MKMLWMLLTVGLTFADKLDRTYLPPPGSTHSGGSPGAINVPLELPKAKYSINDDGRKTPELIIGINRVGPIRLGESFKEISTHKPNIPNSFISPTQTSSSNFKESLPLPIIAKDSSLIPNYNLGNPSINFDDLQQIHNVEKQPSISNFNERSRNYLPPFNGDIINAENIGTSILPSPVNEQEGDISNEDKYIQPDPVSDELVMSTLYSTKQPYNDPISSTPSILQPYSKTINIDMTPNDYYSTTGSQNFPIPIKTNDKEHSVYDKTNVQRPERIQAQSDRHAAILNYGQTLTPDGYAYGYDTSNGISADEEGTATNGVKAKGSYSYMGDDGNIYQIEYTADENGFLPKGAHLPTAPPIPDAILKVIEQASRDKEAGVYDDGSYNEEKYGHKKYQGAYPQTNNIINEVNFSPKNEMNIENGDNFDEYEDLKELNKIDEVIESNLNDYENNFDTKSIPNGNQNRDNSNDSNFQNINLPNKNLNNNYYEHSFLQPENTSLPDEATDGSIHTPDVSMISDKNNEMNSHSASGYNYIVPESPYYDTNKLKSFPSRFSEIDQHSFKESGKNNTEKVTAQPFLTPYVSRKEDDLEVDYFDDQRNQQIYGDDPFLSTSVQGNANPNEEPTNADREFNSLDIPGQEPQYGEKITSQILSPDEEGYFYQNTNKSFITLSPRVSYTSSTAAPVNFSTNINTSQDVIRTPGRSQSAIQTNTSSSIDNSSTKSPISSSPTQTIILNESAEYPDAYRKTDLISTPKIIETSRPELPGVLRFGMNYRSEADIYPEEYGQTGPTDDVIGEDFSGPKQPQRFDSITGYHY